MISSQPAPTAAPRMGALRRRLVGASRWLADTAWGDRRTPVLACVRGLPRNDRDFDPLAASRSDRFHMTCPDLPGRGAADRLPDPMLDQTRQDVTIRMPVQVAQGALSDPPLSNPVARKRQSAAVVPEVVDAGHAPAPVGPAQIAPVRHFPPG